MEERKIRTKEEHNEGKRKVRGKQANKKLKKIIFDMKEEKKSREKRSD